MDVFMTLLRVLLNYIHLITIMVLVGIVFFIRFVSTPLMRRLEPNDPHAIPLLVGAAERVVLFGWITLGIAAMNGFVLMLINAHYKGFMVVVMDDPWSVFMLVKHVVYGLMVLGFLWYSLLVLKNKKALEAKTPLKNGGRFMDTIGLANCALGFLTMIFAAMTRYGYEVGLVVPYTLHTGVLACWIGGLFFVLLIGTPTITNMVKAQEIAPMDGIHHMQMIANRFIKVLWFSMFVAIFSGFSMLFVDTDKYTGFLRDFSGLNLIMAIKQVVFLVTILGAFVVTPAIARLGEKLSQATGKPATKETMEGLLKERAIILTGAKYGFAWLQIVLVITAVLMVVRG